MRWLKPQENEYTNSLLSVVRHYDSGRNYVSMHKGSVQYKDRVDQLVGDRNPRDILLSTIDHLTDLLQNITESQLKEVPTGAWSINDVLQHLVDAEMVNGYRLRMVLTADTPELPGFNQDVWVTRFNTVRDSLEIIREWTIFRSYNLRLIQTLSSGELSRVYIHQERGGETTRDLLHLMAGHDLIHCEQIKRLISHL